MTDPHVVPSCSSRVLVVDDEPGTRSILVDCLEKSGIQCAEAPGAAQALRRVEHAAFDLIITDLLMPDMHGHAFVQKIWEANPAQPILVVTAVAEERLMKDLLLRGAEDVLFKPLNLDMFSAKVLGILARNDHRKKLVFDSVGDVEEKEKAEVGRSLRATTASLQQQLHEIQQHFGATIDALEDKSKKLEKDYVGAVRVLSNLMEHISHFRGSHAARVETFARPLGRTLGLERTELRNLSVGALLHDIGKFGMPDDILRKHPNDLSKSERIVYERHPLIGATLIGEVPGAAGIMDIIEEHHENYDGSGFPSGKKKTSAPLAARILKIADGVDNFYHYGQQEGRDWNAVIAHLRHNSDTLYDPKLAELAVQHIQSLMALKQKIVEVRTCDLRTGQRLAGDLYDSDGRLLVREGIELTEAMLDRLRRLWRTSGHGQSIHIQIHVDS